MHLNVGYLGLALVLVGATLLASPTLGFETIAADRTTDVSTTDDLNALLGVVDNSASDDANIQNKNDQSVLYYLNDNAGEFPQATDLQANVVSSPTEVSGLSASIQPSNSEHDYELVVDCGTGKDQGTVTVLIEGTGAVSVEMQRTTTDTIDVNCGGGNGGGNGPANFVASDVQGSDDQWTQTFEFEAEGMDGEATIDLSDAQANSGVDYSDAEISSRSGAHQNDDFNFDQNTQQLTYTPHQGNPKGLITIELSGLQLTDGSGGVVSYYDGNREDSDQFEVTYSVSGTQDGDVDTSGNVAMDTAATIDGDVDAGGDLSGGDRVTVTGETDVDGGVQTGNTASFENDLNAGGDISTGRSLTVSGDVTSEGSLTAGNSANLDGKVDVGDDLTVGARSDVGGEIDAGGSVTVGGESELGSDLSANGDVSIGQRTTVNGAIDTESGGTVTMESGSTVTGEIDAAGGVTIQSNAEASTDVSAVGDVSLEGGATIGGDLSTEGTFYGCTDQVDGEIDADAGIESTC